jgi:MoxR-like ATPase
VTCPQCSRVFQKRSGYNGHIQFSACGKAIREAGEQQLQHLTSRFPIPPPDPHWYLAPDFERCLERWNTAASRGAAVNVVLVGPPSTGKTSSGREFAARTGHRFLDVAASLWAEAGESLGRFELKGGVTRFRQALWLEFLEQVPGGVLLLDELNRVQDLRALNVLLPLLDHRGAAFIEPLDREVHRATGTVVIATMNRDPADPGLSTLSAALMNRADFVRCETLPPGVEARILVSRTSISATKAERIVRFATSLRQAPLDRRVPVSLRQLLRVAEVAAGDSSLSLVDAVQPTIAHAFDQDDDGVLAQHILQAAQMANWPSRGRGQ